jgi:hypothetical protein
MIPLIPFCSEVCRHGTRNKNAEPAGGVILHGGLALAQQFKKHRRQPVGTQSHSY